MTESSSNHLPAACPEWCGDDSRHTTEDGTTWHSTAQFELATLDGPIRIGLEQADGITDGSGGVLINLDRYDIRVDEARRLAAQLVAWADLVEQ